MFSDSENECTAKFIDIRACRWWNFKIHRFTFWGVQSKRRMFRILLLPFFQIKIKKFHISSMMKYEASVYLFVAFKFWCFCLNLMNHMNSLILLVWNCCKRSNLQNSRNFFFPINKHSGNLLKSNTSIESFHSIHFSSLSFK